MKDKAKKFWYFKKICLLANITINIALDIIFLTLSKAKLNVLSIAIFGIYYY